MFKKHKYQHSSTWSPDMLKELQGFLLNLPIPEITFFIRAREMWCSFEKNKCRESISYLGGISWLEDVVFGLSTADGTLEEYQNSIGYIEILNGNIEPEFTSVPMIRGFIIKDIGFFETVNKILIESKTLHANKSLTLQVLVDSSPLKDVPSEKLLNMKLSIKRVSLFQRVSFV